MVKEKVSHFLLTFAYILILLLGIVLVSEHKENDRLNDTIVLKDSIIVSQQQQIDSVRVQFKKLLESLEFISKVDVTMYNAVPGQTDKTPYETASGAIIDPHNATEHRWIAISRDLQKRWGGPLTFGDIVYVKGTGKYDGLYKVNDNMNPRYKNRIDILRTKGDESFAFIGRNVELYRVQTNDEIQLADSRDWSDFHQYMNMNKTAK